MIWADRVAVVWAVIVYAILAWLTGSVPHTATPAINDALWLGLVGVIVPWLFLRGLDWIFSGAIRWRQMPRLGKSL